MPGVPYHITQRGVDRRETFSFDYDYAAYLRLLGENLEDVEVALLGWCLMPNHVHLIAVPEREDSLNVLLRRVQGRYAQYYNARIGRSGHLWQNRFFACALGPGHLWAALAYVDRNPVAAGLATWAAGYRWSSASVHMVGVDASGLLDEGWWRSEAPSDWDRRLDQDDHDAAAALRQCTHAGRPFGSASFVSELGERFGRTWIRGRPKKEVAARSSENSTQIRLSPFSLR